MIAQVIVDIAHSEVDKIFDYSCTRDVTPGCRVVVPFGNMKIEGFVIGIKEKSDYQKELKPILRVMDEVPAITEESLSLMRFMCDKYHIPCALALRQFLPAEMRKGKVREKMVKLAKLNPEIPVQDMLSSLKKNAKGQIGAIEFLSDGKTAKIADLNKDFGNTAISKLVTLNYILTEEVRLNRSPYGSVTGSHKDVELVKEQTEAINSILFTDKTVTLLHGVTGSGKTEVYLRLIKKALDEGKTAIMLVPEISLTPQMLTQLRATFKDTAAILHSGLSAGEKFDEWWRLRAGEAKVAVGARSAIFAPLENLGLIIIDEEHDGSYVSESSPRYDTKDIAEFRAKYNGCKLVLGSATPSVTTYLKAKSGEYNLAVMPERINKKPLPEMIIADMRKEIRRGNNSAFSGALQEELKKCLDSGNQAIIFLNRRGYSQMVVCRECGYVAKCENCDIALNYHSVGNILKCHYCGAAYKMLDACPECGSVHINYVGTGTQKVVNDLKTLFPQAKILRMDNDTTSTKEGHFKILSAFARHEADILVGTQMIAKGHDFPSVTLVGILDADMSLLFADYRSGERTFQLITQVAGRSGRADDKGVVVLQTYQPENAILKFATAYDYLGFYERENSLRKVTCYPPYSTILRVMIESEDDDCALNTLKIVNDKLFELFNKHRDEFLFYNKMKSPIKRLKNKYRYQVLMRIREGNEELIDEIYELALPETSSKTLVYIEINPSNLS